MEHEPAVYLITGPMAAGKSTVARLLAARFPRGVHLEGYAALKRDLAERHGADRDAYTDAKTAFIAASLRAADPPEGV